MVNPGQDLTVIPRFTRRLLAFPVPLQPATGVGNGAILFRKAGGRQAEHLGLNRRRIDIVRFTVVLPEGRGFGHQRVDDDHVLQLAQAANDFVLVREGRYRVKALADIPRDIPLIHHIEILNDVVRLVPLRQPLEAPVVLFLRRVAVEGFHQADVELRIVAPVVHLIRQRRFWRVGLKIRLQICLLFRRQRQVTRQAGGEQAEVGESLNIGVTAQRIYAAPCHPHVAEQQLDHRHGADVLRTHGVLRPAQRIQEGRCSVCRTGGGQHFAHFQEVRFRRTADVLHHVRRIAGNMLLQQVPHAARVRQCFIAHRIAVFVELIVPRGLVVLAFFRVIAAEQPVVEGKVIPHQQVCVGVVLNVFRVNFVVFDQVQQYAGQERNVRAGADRRIDIGHRSRARKARIDDDQRRIVVVFRFHRPAESHWMGFSGVTAHYHHDVSVFDINPVVGHRTATKCWSKTCYRWSVSDARLVINRQHAERAHKFLRQHAGFITGRRGT